MISAAVLAPLALAMVWIGGWALAAFIALAALMMGREWSRLSALQPPSLAPAALAAVTLAAIVLAALGAWTWATALLTLASTAALSWGLVRRPLAWLGAGILYIGLPCLALLWLRALPAWGLETLVWVLALVWAVDTGAYFAGRAIGGPRLAPRISPSKTWAGLGGGVAVALVVGAAAALLSGARVLPLVLVSGGLALVEQAGDLMESAIKRHFHVKDAGRLIPGHGGLMDRVDGLMAVLLAVAALTMASGRSPLAW